MLPGVWQTVAAVPLPTESPPPPPQKRLCRTSMEVVSPCLGGFWEASRSRRQRTSHEIVAPRFVPGTGPVVPVYPGPRPAQHVYVYISFFLVGRGVQSCDLKNKSVLKDSAKKSAEQIRSSLLFSLFSGHPELRAIVSLQTDKIRAESVLREISPHSFFFLARIIFIPCTIERQVSAASVCHSSASWQNPHSMLHQRCTLP